MYSNGKIMGETMTPRYTRHANPKNKTDIHLSCRRKRWLVLLPSVSNDITRMAVEFQYSISCVGDVAAALACHDHFLFLSAQQLLRRF